MACNCNEINYDCGGANVSSNCVQWVGKIYEALGICKGNPLTFVVEAIIDKLLELLDAENAPPDVSLDNCLVMKQALAGKDETVDNLLQILIDYQCTLTELIEAVEAKIPTTDPYAFQLQCVTPVGSPTNRDAIIQGLINKVCALEVTVNDLGTNIDQIINTKLGDFIGTAIKSLGNRGIQKAGSGASTTYTFLALVPAYAAVAYFGPLSNFDAAGHGLVGTDVEGWYLINGVDGLQDARGRTLVAAVAGVPGGPLDAAVDPSNSLNPGTNYGLGAKFGENYHRLTIPEMPSHTHPLVDPGHTHDYTKPRTLSNGDKSGIPDYVAIENGKTSSATTGITIGAAGGGDIHENRQPSLAITGWIMRLD